MWEPLSFGTPMLIVEELRRWRPDGFGFEVHAGTDRRIEAEIGLQRSHVDQLGRFHG